MKNQTFRERECIHRDGKAEGDFYNGVSYVQALQLLNIDEAMKAASRVSSFFWSDAPQIMVWLCLNCASALELHERPRAISQSSRRQA